MPGTVPGTRDKDRACKISGGKAWNRETSFKCVQQHQGKGGTSFLRGGSALFLAH